MFLKNMFLNTILKIYNVKEKGMALENFSIDIVCEEITVILGQKGAGKGSLLKALIGKKKMKFD